VEPSCTMIIIIIINIIITWSTSITNPSWRSRMLNPIASAGKEMKTWNPHPP
jgi:hypothetical protein